MRLSARRLNRSTLQRQLLLRREPLGVTEAVGRVLALQAQEAASPYVALWNRVRDLDPADVHAAFVAHRIVKATLMRITLHAVTATDYPPLQNAMAASLRQSRVFDNRYKGLGLSPDVADAVLPQVLEFAAEARTNAEFEAMLTERLGELPKPGLWWALRTFAPVVHAVTGGPWSFGPRPSYRVARTPPVDEDRLDSVRHLALRYLQAFGPATVADLGQFTLLPRSVLRPAIAELDLVRHEGPDGAELLDVPDAEIPNGDVPAPPRLMAMWDSTLLAYADRTRIIPERYRREVIRNNGDTLPTLLVDGYVAGVWRPVDGGIEATAFHPLTDDDWTGLADEARALCTFLADREQTVYRRYARWWDRLPDGDVRLLPG